MTSEFNCFVFVYLEGALAAVPAGALTLVEESTRLVSSRFGYGKNYLERSNAVPVDPVSRSLQDAVPGTARVVTPVNGLEVFGAIRDAMPDNWGRRVIENRLKRPRILFPSPFICSTPGRTDSEHWIFGSP